MKGRQQRRSIRFMRFLRHHNRPHLLTDNRFADEGTVGENRCNVVSYGDQNHMFILSDVIKSVAHK